ncbi:MAG: Type 1 glutamine amidotransferase-like domain-containing protein [Candidatus Dormibacteraceae bacterium]
MGGPLALVGGDEFHLGNEPQDRLLAAAAAGGTAYVLPTAAARSRPDLASAHARRWFAGLGLEVRELPVLTRSDARSERLAELAAGGHFFYLVGGDPGLVVRVLADTPVWRAIAAAWASGAALAGSSAGAMALCRWTLIRAGWPVHDARRYRDALGVVPGTALLPHFETFGRRWVPSARAAMPAPDVCLLGVDERTAAVWESSRWRCYGAGGVTVIRDGSQARFASGGELTGIPAPLFEGSEQPGS